MPSPPSPLPTPPSAHPDDDDDDLGEEDDDDDLEEDEDDDDMDVYEDEDDVVPRPNPSPTSAAVPPPPPEEEPNSSPSSSTDDDDRVRSVNGTTSALIPTQPTAVLSIPAVPPDSSRPSRIGEDERRSFSSIEERRLFQRLWTDDDEITILEGFYDFTSSRGTTHHAHQHDTGPFYEQIKNRLQLDFTKNQLVEKIRRLKKKYRNVVTRMSSGRDFNFKSPHERAIYDIARRIWSGSVAKKSSASAVDNEDGLPNHPHQSPLDDHRVRRGIKRPASDALVVSRPETAIPVEVKSIPAIPISVTPPPPPPAAAPPPPNSGSSGVVEETVKSCFSPLVKDLVQYAVTGAWSQGGGGLPGAPLMGMGLMPLPLTPNNSDGSISKDAAAALDGRWRKQQILELEVYSKRLELVQELIKVKIEELRSLG